MSNKRPTVRLAEVLKPVSRPTTPDVSRSYRLLGVRLDGNGAFHRETVTGAETSASQLFEVADGDFIYSRLFAWRGAFGLISRDLAGAYVSSEFPTFRADEKRLDPRYLNYWFRLPDTLRRVEADCTGSTPLTRNRFKENFFLNLEISLPSLGEQRRIVDLIEAVSGKVEEARRLREGAETQTDALSASMLYSVLPRNVDMRRLGDLISAERSLSYGVLVPGPDVDDGVPFVRVQDLDMRHPPAIPNKRIARDVDAKYERTRLRGGEILIGVVGSIGKVGIAPASWSGANIARAVCRITPNANVDRDYLALVLSGQFAQDYFRESTRTLAQPTLNVGQLAETPIPVPAMKEQLLIVSVLNRLQGTMEVLRASQKQAMHEVDALLPSVLDKALRGGT